MINIFQPALGDEELAAIAEVFRSNWIGKGNATLDFEKAFAAALNIPASEVTSTTCCTEGLFLAGEIFNFQKGDEIIVPSISFVAVGSAVLSRGAKLVLCDVDSRSLNVTIDHILPCLTSSTKAIYINHYGGVPCEMDPILEVCSSRGIMVIEDSACAVRSFYRGRACGTLGDMGIWSFDPMKTICTGDGGMLWFRSPSHLEVAKEMLYLGLPNRQKSGMDSSEGGNARWWEYQVERPGRRAILNNIAGAIGTVQMKKLDRYVARRKEIYERYAKELGDVDGIVVPPPIPAYSASSYYFFWIQVQQRDELARYLLEKKIYSTFRYWPLHRVDLFKPAQGHFPSSDLAASITLNLPLHQSLSDDDVSSVIEHVRGFVSGYA